MTDEGRAEAAAAFRAQLHKLYDAVGQPTYRQMGRQAALEGHKLAAATLHDLLHGDSTPRWGTVEAFVTACCAYADARIHRQNLPAELTDLDAWRRRYEDMQSSIDERSDQEGHPNRLRKGSRGSRPVVPRQLPKDVARFTGRSEHLAQLDRQTIWVISGIGGVGKTSLAVHWAHSVADRFADGQLYVDLQGFDANASPMDPGDAVRGFLEALGVPPERIPAQLHAQCAMYRSFLADRRILVLLDNARDSEQVRPLLPGTPTATVIVTSRNQLSGLVAVDGAHPLTVDLLTDAEARELLAGRLGPQRMRDETQAVDEIVAQCAGLPLALGIVAGRAAIHPKVPLSELADELRNADDRLDPFSGRDPVADVRVVFSCSYTALTREAADLFRLLWLHPGREISVGAAAGLAGISARQVQPLLGELNETGLVVESRLARYTLHDLLRAYANDLAKDLDTEERQHTAVLRMLNWYLHAADAAGRAINGDRSRRPLAAPPLQGALLEFSDHEAALDWCEMERTNLIAATRVAVEHHEDETAWQLPLALVDYFDRRKHWADWITINTFALTAAERFGEPFPRATTHNSLGVAWRELGQLETALHHFQMATDIYDHEDIGNAYSRAMLRTNMGNIMTSLHQHDEALALQRQALALMRDVDSEYGEGLALENLGNALLHAGQPDEALERFDQALVICRRIGDRTGEAATLDSIGETFHKTGRTADAVERLQEALPIRREVCDLYRELLTLTKLGDYLHTTDPSAAHAFWQDAFTIADQLMDPNADAIRARREQCGCPQDDRPD